MTKWRYTTVDLQSHLTWTLGIDFDRQSLDAVLKEYGQRGWELASTIEITQHHTNRSILIFKQPMEEEQNERTRRREHEAQRTDRRDIRT